MAFNFTDSFLENRLGLMIIIGSFVCASVQKYPEANYFAYSQIKVLLKEFLQS